MTLPSQAADSCRSDRPTLTLPLVPGNEGNGVGEWHGAGVTHPIDRATANDQVTMVTDRGPVPMNLGAALVLTADADLTYETVRSTLTERLPRVRRLRQRLVPTPLGCGRPVWVDDASFDLSHHLSEVVVPAASGRTGDPRGASHRRLLEAVADLVTTPLPRHRPLWAARWVTGWAPDQAALVLVMHHALADGIGGLAVLAALSDGGIDPEPMVFPQPAPARRSLARAARHDRMVAWGRLPSRIRAGRQGMRELAGARPRTAAARTTLNRATGPRRRLTSVNVALAPLIDLAHRRGVTVNDLVLTAVSGAVGTVLLRRGEHLHELMVSEPISARRSATVAELGNQTGVVVLPIITDPDRDARLRTISALSASRRGQHRGTSAMPMGLAFRALAALGVFQFFIDHQRLVHTFVTNVRGPTAPMTFAAHEVMAVMPVAVTPGNVGLCFEILSYAGQLAVTVVADPDVVGEQDLLTNLLEEEFAQLMHPNGDPNCFTDDRVTPSSVG